MEHPGNCKERTNTMTKETVILCGTGYSVTVQDNQVIFEEAICVWGSSSCFCLERPIDINNSPGIWWLTHLEESSGRIPASNIVQAVKWCEDNFGKSFEPYKGALKTEFKDK